MTTHTEAALRGDLPLLNRTVAELVGWTQPNGSGWSAPGTTDGKLPAWALPDFTGSLDACRTFEEGLTEDEQDKYQAILKRIAHHKRRYIWKLDPPDHCIAFCRLKEVCE